MSLSPEAAAAHDDRPIGVFDSGVGGLSVLNALQAELPHEHFVYYADTAHAPYGERGDAFVDARTRAVTEALIDAHRIKALVIACNTATASSIHWLRAEHPALSIVGVEPALKPAVAASHTRRIAVLATRGTLNSAKFAALQASLSSEAEFILVPCDGLATAIEQSDAINTGALCARYMGAAGQFGLKMGEIDTVVLGCTHYPFVAVTLRSLACDGVNFIDTGWPVARQTRRLLTAAGQLAAGPGRVTLSSSGSLPALRAAAARWLQAAPAVHQPVSCT